MVFLRCKHTFFKRAFCPDPGKERLTQISLSLKTGTRDLPLRVKFCPHLNLTGQFSGSHQNSKHQQLFQNKSTRWLSRELSGQNWCTVVIIPFHKLDCTSNTDPTVPTTILQAFQRACLWKFIRPVIKRSIIQQTPGIDHFIMFVCLFIGIDPFRGHLNSAPSIRIYPKFNPMDSVPSYFHSFPIFSSWFHHILWLIPAHLED